MKRSNVLLIMTDQHRFDALRCYGNDNIDTPYLDWIASKGTLFENAYTPSPSCIPARACLLTGMNQWHTGILGMGRGQGPMGVGFEHTLPGELAKAGYHTQGIGKMHFSPQRALNGFHNTLLDESSRAEKPDFISDYRKWFLSQTNGQYDINDHGVNWNSWMARPYHAPEYLHPTNWTVNESISFLKRRDPTKPFFLKMSFARPHSPYDALPYYFDMYLKKDLPKPYVGEWAHIHDVPEDAADPNAWRGVRTPEEIHRARAGYYGNVNHIDSQIGRLLEFLKKAGELDNTCIIFTSDHGDMLGDHNLWRKTYAYEGSAHIPLIVCLPQSVAEHKRKRADEPVTLYDIMPTILDAIGADIPDTVDGKSLIPLINGEDSGWREYIHGEHSTCYSEEQEMQFVTDGKWKYIWFPRLGTEQLFDLTNDPGECHDLAQNKDYQDELLKWRSRLIKELEPRNLGLVDGGKLVCQKGKPPIVSPHYEKRISKTRI
ncbi:MAG: arylsulfatase [Clostridiales bacterium]|nr:arylsulfatase [Clostridiales bacterium]